MNTKDSRVAIVRHALRVLGEMTEVIATSSGNGKAKDTAHTIGRMLKGINEDRDTETYLKAVSWTLGQVQIEIDDLLREGG